MRQCRRDRDLQDQEPAAGAQGARHVVVGALHAGDARPGEHSERKRRRQRDQERAGRRTGREDEEGKRQPGRRRQRPDQAHQWMDPVARALGPAQRDTDREAHDGADREAAEQQQERGEQRAAQPLPVVGIDLDEGLGRGEERQRQEIELGCHDLPAGEPRRQHQQPGREAAELRQPGQQPAAGISGELHRAEGERERAQQLCPLELLHIGPGEHQRADRQPGEAGGGQQQGRPRQGFVQTGDSQPPRTCFRNRGHELPLRPTRRQ